MLAKCIDRYIIYICSVAMGLFIFYRQLLIFLSLWAIHAFYGPTHPCLFLWNKLIDIIKYMWTMKPHFCRIILCSSSSMFLCIISRRANFSTVKSIQYVKWHGILCHNTHLSMPRDTLICVKRSVTKPAHIFVPCDTFPLPCHVTRFYVLSDTLVCVIRHINSSHKARKTVSVLSVTWHTY